jgi:hypothetical protein
MAVTFISVGTPRQGNAATFDNISLPPSYAVGDLLVLAALARTSSETITVDNGYSLIHKSTGSGQSLFGKIATSSEVAPTATYSGTTRHVAQIAAFRGVDTNFTSPNATAQSSLGSNTALNYPALTPTVDNCLVLYFGRYTQNTTGSNLSSDPISGFTEIGDVHENQGTTSSVYFVWDYQIQTTATAISSGSWPLLSTPDGNTQQTIAVALAAASGGGSSATISAAQRYADNLAFASSINGAGRYQY